MIPLLHDFTDESVLVFGGGTVGARKARRFAREAAVLVVSPSFAAEDFGDAERVRAAPDETEIGDWLDRVGPALVVAATDDAGVNEAIATAAEERNVLVNRADRAGSRPANSVVVPATVRDGPVTLAVATDGSSPALSRHLRQRLDADLAGVGEVARRTRELRERLASEGVPAEERRAVVRSVVRHDAVWKALGTGTAKVEQAVVEAISENTGD